MNANGFALPAMVCARHTGTWTCYEGGAALLVFLLILALMSSYISFDCPVRLLAAPVERNAATVKDLSEVRTALIAWAVTLRASPRHDLIPGLLPFPDRNEGWEL